MFGVLVFHLILCITHVQTYILKIGFVVDALPVSADGPDGPLAKLGPAFSQCARAIGFQLISNRLAGITAGGNNDVNMTRSGINLPQVPISMDAMTPTFGFNSYALRGQEQDNFMFQAALVPMSEWQPWSMIAMTSPAPARFVALQVSAVNGPGNEVSKRITKFHCMTPV